MRAAVLRETTGPDGLMVEDRSEPVAGEGEVLVDVAAAGVVFPDLLMTRGEYQRRPDLPFVPGWEVSGTVRTDAPEAGLRTGQPVVAMPGIGGFAEVAAVEVTRVFPLPEDYPLVEAAALPLNYLTMEFALRHRARLEPGETVLVHGAAGGVGSAACQLAAARGARVLAVVSTPAKAKVAEAAGAHEVVLLDGFLQSVKDLTCGRGVDLVVDPVGGDRFTDSLRALATGGRLVVLGFTGRSIPTVKVNRLLLTNTSVLGAASQEHWTMHPEAPRQQWDSLLPMVEERILVPPVGETFPLDRVADALRRIDDREALGRLVVDLRA